MSNSVAQSESFAACQSRRRSARRLRTLAVAVGLGVLAPATLATAAGPAAGGSGVLGARSPGHDYGDSRWVTRAALEPGRINHIIVIDLENEDYDVTFGAGSPAQWLNQVLVPQGQLIENYYATSHVSQGNYISQVSGQPSTETQNNDCIDVPRLLSGGGVVGAFNDIVPGTIGADGIAQGDGCVFPAGVKTIADQLDAKYGMPSRGRHGHRGRKYEYPWRLYAEDMGNIPSRDYGTPDPLGGTTCAHPPINGVDNSNSAVAGDGYATRHNPFVYFHSVIDNQALCDQRIVPLGKLTVGKDGAADVFTGHLAEDLRSKRTTPAFAMVVPDLCNDGHDHTCKPADVGGTATDVEGGMAGGLSAADLWLKHWIPMMMQSPAYQSGEMLIVITLDEADYASPTAGAACCNQRPGPGQKGNPGYSTLLGKAGYQKPPTADGQYPGGGKVGALLLNNRYITPGINTTGSYNHYSALRSYEDLLGLTSGGTDGYGHLGFAAAPDLVPFGPDVFNRRHRR